MGVVYLGRHQMLDRDVAVKFLLNAVAGPDDPGFAGFVEGARAAARLEHPGLTTIHHADVVDDIPYLVMQYVDGPALSDVLKLSGPLSLPVTLAILESVSEAIGELHDRGIIHRDIKPGNVILGLDGRVVVTDFGLALARPLGRRGPSNTRLGGTPAYMAPEMFTGEVSLQSDVYALGMMVYAMVTGELAYTGTLDEVREQHQREPLPVDPLRRLGLDGTMIEMLERATHKQAMFRYKTARHFLSALKPAIITDELLRTGAVELQQLVRRSPTTEPNATTEGTNPGTPTTVYFDRLAEIAGEKRSSRGSTDEVPQERPQTEHCAEVLPVSRGDHPVEAESKTDPSVAATLIDDVPCAKCDYNLRGLTAVGRCPECGEPIDSSIRRNRLLFANPKWLATIARGQAIIFAAITAIPIAPVVIAMVAGALAPQGNTDGFQFTMVLLMFVSGAVVTGGIAIGVFLSTRREPAFEPPQSLSVIRWIARVCAAVGVFGVIASANVSVSLTGDGPPRSGLVANAGWLKPITLAACLIGCTVLLLYLRKLAERIPNEKLLRTTRQLTWLLYALVPVTLLCRTLNATFISADSVANEGLMFWLRTASIGIPSILFIAIVFLYWSLMAAYGRSIKRVISVAVSHNTIFGDVPDEVGPLSA